MSEIDVTLKELAEKVDGLTDLFKRRLMDDRAKVALIEDLHNRLTESEKRASADAKKPLVEAIALVIDRLQDAEPSEALIRSIESELQYVLEAVVGVNIVEAQVGQEVDRAVHQVVEVSGEGSLLLVEKQQRLGYQKDGVLLRPADVCLLYTSPSPRD